MTRDDPLTRELVAMTSALQGTLTELAASLRGNSQNHVLYSGLRRLDDGVLTMTFAVPMASVAVGTCHISSGQQVTVAAAPPSADAPDEGAGVNVLPASTWQLWPLTGNVLTIWGPATERVWIGVWSAPQPPCMAISTESA